MISREFTRYWRRKYTDAAFHSNRHGGARSFKFDYMTRNLIEHLIWFEVNKDPTNVLQYYVYKVRKILNIDISKNYISKIFKGWRWSWKILDVRKMEKYTPGNIYKYMVHVMSVSSLPIAKLKYMDESGFQLKDIRRRYGVGPVGKRVSRRLPSRLRERLNLILMSSLTNETPFYCEVTESKVDQYFIYQFVLHAIEQGYLIPGDYLIMDNASFHGAKDTFADLVELLTLRNVYLIFLPTYSPELNPVELIFGWVKSFCKRHSVSYNIKQEIMLALSMLEIEAVCGFYYKCIYELNV